MRFSHRVFLYGPFGLVVILALAVTVTWFATAHALTKRIAALNNHDIAPGVRLHFDRSEISGFPFRFDTTFTGLRLALSGPRHFSWRSDEFAMHRLSYDSSKFVFETGGKQHFGWVEPDGRPAGFIFLPGSVRADAIIGSGRLTRFDLVVVALDSLSLTAGRVEVHLRHDPVRDALDLAVYLSDLSGISGQKSLNLRFDTRITKAKRLENLLAGNQDWRQAAEGWRKAHGAIALLHVDHDGKNTVSHAVLRLDDRHRLTGPFPPVLTGGSTLVATAPLY